jgi:hypothetical protein
MKHTLALVLIVLGIVGCATTYDNNFSGWEMSQNKLPTVNGALSKYQGRYFGYKINYKLNEVTIKTDGIFRFDKNYARCKPGLWGCLGKDLLKIEANKLCMSSFSAPIFFITQPNFKKEFSRYGQEIWEYSDTTITARCWNPDKYILQQDAQKQEQSLLEQRTKKLVLEKKKTKCRDYGFKDDSDGMGMCLIELDKLAAIKNQSEQANQAQLQALQQQQAEAKRQREANALMNLGAIIGGAGTPAPSSTRSKAATPSYPTYTSSMTVPSNQLCPLLASPVVKQEVVRGNRICYYQ